MADENDEVEIKPLRNTWGTLFIFIGHFLGLAVGTFIGLLIALVILGALADAGYVVFDFGIPFVQEPFTGELLGLVFFGPILLTAFLGAFTGGRLARHIWAAHGRSITKGITNVRHNRKLVIGVSIFLAIIFVSIVGYNIYGIATQPKPNVHVLFSPDGRLVTTRIHNNLYAWDVGTGEQVFKIANLAKDCEPDSYMRIGKRCGLPSISPDGTRIVVFTNSGLHMWEAKTGDEIPMSNDYCGNKHIQSLDWRPDGSQLVVGCEYWPNIGIDAQVIDAENGMTMLRLSGNGASINQFSFSPTGEFILGFRTRSGRVWDARTGKKLVEFGGERQNVIDVSFNPKGHSVAVAELKGNVTILDIIKDEAILTFQTDELFSLEQLAYSPDGRKLVTAGTIETAVWDAATGDKLLSIDGYERLLGFDPTGNKIFGQRGSDYMVWDAETGELIYTLPNVYSIDINSNGKEIVTGTDDGRMVLWNAETGEQVREFDIP